MITSEYLMYNTRKLASSQKKKLVLQMVALDLNPPIKHAGLVPVSLGKLINKTLTTDNWHRERGR